MSASKFLITGGTGFIGLCVARNLIRRRIPAVITDESLDAAAVELLVREAAESGSAIDTLPLDVGDLASVTAAFAPLHRNRRWVLSPQYLRRGYA
jgi:NAD(P)-dependent dehydrogenase (short-subunit alcohol dehydrogenase family)